MCIRDSAYGVPVIHCPTPQTWRRALSELQRTDLIVDAILGTGLHKPAGGLYAEAIQALNQLGKPIIAVDLPSGLSADHGTTLGAYVQATVTVTFALPKRCHVLYPAAAAAGRLHIADIGIPQQAIAVEEIPVALLEEADIRFLLPSYPPHTHKGHYGHLLVVAGSLGKTGAGVLASEAALRTGAGLVTLAVPSSLNSAMESRLTEVMTLPVAEGPMASITDAAVPELCRFLERASALVLGPGLGTHPATQACVHALIRHAPVPIVLDADGINSLIGNLDILRQRKAPVILTPHPGEMARLLGTDTATVQAERLEIACSLARHYQVIVVLKGAYTIVYAPDGRRWVNPTGNAALATAGTGDILAGMIGALLCQGLQPLHAAQCGVYLHGLAGDRLQHRLGPRGLIASDLLTEIPAAFRTVREGKPCHA